MDDRRIQQLTDEVLAQVRQGRAGAAATGLEARVTALETAVQRLQETQPAIALAAPPPHIHVHPSLGVLGISGGGAQCLLEPDKPCVQSHACRTFGH